MSDYWCPDCGTDDPHKHVSNVPHDCPVCSATFPSLKQMRTHQAGAHREENCPTCGELVGIRGMSRHEQLCRAKSGKFFDWLLPHKALLAKMRDWLERAEDVPDLDDAMCVVCQEGDPAFVRLAAVHHWMRDRGMCVVFPANRITKTLFHTPPKRDRRTGINDKPTGETYDSALLPGWEIADEDD